MLGFRFDHVELTAFAFSSSNLILRLRDPQLAANNQLDMVNYHVAVKKMLPNDKNGTAGLSKATTR